MNNIKFSCAATSSENYRADEQANNGDWLAAKGYIDTRQISCHIVGQLVGYGMHTQTNAHQIFPIYSTLPAKEGRGL